MIAFWTKHFAWAGIVRRKTQLPRRSRNTSDIASRREFWTSSERSTSPPSTTTSDSDDGRERPRRYVGLVAGSSPPPNLEGPRSAGTCGPHSRGACFYHWAHPAGASIKDLGP